MNCHMSRVIESPDNILVLLLLVPLDSIMMLLTLVPLDNILLLLLLVLF